MTELPTRVNLRRPFEESKSWTETIADPRGFVQNDGDLWTRMNSLRRVVDIQRIENCADAAKLPCSQSGRQGRIFRLPGTSSRMART